MKEAAVWKTCFFPDPTQCFSSVSSVAMSGLFWFVATPKEEMMDYFTRVNTVCYSWLISDSLTASSVMCGSSWPQHVNSVCMFVWLFTGPPKRSTYQTQHWDRDLRLGKYTHTNTSPWTFLTQMHSLGVRGDLGTIQSFVLKAAAAFIPLCLSRSF